jgi:Cdc6-like AAA superfamily ATPase
LQLVRGTISNYNRGNGSHTVEFTDGEILDCQLHKEAAVIWPGKVITCGEKSVRKGDAIILKRADTLPKWPQNQRGTSVKFSLDDAKYSLKKLKQRSFPVDKIPPPTTYEMPFTPEQAVDQTVHVAFKVTKKGGNTVDILKFYRGEIKTYHPNSGRHTVAFEDGQIERYNLVNETVIWSDGTVTCGEQSSFDNRTGKIQIKPADDMPTWPLSGKKGRRSSATVTPCQQKKIQLTTTGMKFHNNNNGRKRKGGPVFTTTDDGMVVAAAITKQAEPVRHQVDTMALGGVTFKVGDAVYVVSNEQMLDEINQAEQGQLTGLDKHLFHCGVCGSDACDEDSHAMVECGRCLQGYHLACLDPPLTEVPERDWVCSKCAAGKKAPSRRACCARDYFLQNRGLSLARIDTIWKVIMDNAGDDDSPTDDGSCSFEFTGQWYCLPEETHCGRQPEHAAREVFLSFNQDLVDASSILRPAKVLSPGHFNTDRSGDEDMYVCEYAYDAVWQRFRRVSALGKDQDDDNDDDDDEEEEEFDLEEEEEEEEEGEGWEAGTAETAGITTTFGKTKAMRISGGLLDLAATTVTTTGKLKSGKGGGRKRRGSSSGGFLGGSSRFKRGASKYAGLDGDDDDEGKDATFRAADAVADDRGKGWMENIRKTGGKRKLQGGEGGELLLLKRRRIDEGAADEDNSNQHQQQEQRQRQQYDDYTPASRLSRARHQLTLAVVPASLPCREVERTEIYTFVESAIRGGDAGGSCLYVSGIPGTGKTATVMEVMRTMQRLSDCGDMPAFQFVELNGLRLPSPQHAYTALYEALSGKKVGPAAAVAGLEEVLGIKGRRGHLVVDRPVIVLVDEMDLLVNKNQSVLYNLFDWPSREGSRLNIIGVANTMDLPERLHPRIGSRLAGRRVVFHPYSRAQLESIVNSRLQAVGEGAFDPGAVSYMARKVANCSGDLRRCLELCRRAAEIAEAELHRSLNGGGGGTVEGQQQQQGDGVDNNDNNSQDQDQGQLSTATAITAATTIITGKVTIAHANAAIQEMFNTPHVRMLKGAPRLERIVLASMLLEARYSGCSESTLGDIAERLYGLCKGNGEPQPAFGTIMMVVASLSAKRLIICLDSLNKRVHAKLTLNVPSYDLIHVLGVDENIPWLANRVNAAT